MYLAQLALSPRQYKALINPTEAGMLFANSLKNGQEERYSQAAIFYLPKLP
jgi:hypothetical protein